MFVECPDFWPETLRAYRQFTVDNVDRSLFDENGQWVAERLFYSLLYAEKRSKSQAKRLLCDELALIRPLLVSTTKGSVVTNWHWCPDFPYGNYIIHFHVGVAIDLIYCHRELCEGFVYSATNDGKISRDDNPFDHSLVRRASWDRGYILGLSEQPLRKWMQSKGVLLS